jgi:hypothetical protein
MEQKNIEAEVSRNILDDSRQKIKVGITHGDTNGVGYELIFKTFADSGMLELCTPVVYGSAKLASFHKKAVGADVTYHVVESGAEAHPNHLNLVNCFDEEVKVEFGSSNPEAGHAAFLALERATEELKEGKIDVLVTAPINKSSIQSSNFHFSGHTEYLEERLGSEHGTLMILTNSLMRVALVTTHLPVHEVAEAITLELVELKLRLFQYSLRHDFLLSMPRIAVLGLNPHNGDSGVIGKEESEIIKPVIEKLVGEGKHIFGPYSADGFFGAGLYQYFDGVLAMYHDQGLAPFKALSMDDGVNFTAGLPFVRTSPDHGTAYDIAGTGTANPDSFRQAVFSAIDIYRNRQKYKEATKNPLPKLYRDRREDGERPRRFSRERTDMPSSNNASDQNSNTGQE